MKKKSRLASELISLYSADVSVCYRLRRVIASGVVHSQSIQSVLDGLISRHAFGGHSPRHGSRNTMRARYPRCASRVRSRSGSVDDEIPTRGWHSGEDVQFIPIPDRANLFL